MRGRPGRRREAPLAADRPQVTGADRRPPRGTGRVPGAGPVLAVLDAGGSGLDAGSVGLALARRWSDAGGMVLFVDADPAGARLAERYGETARAAFSPATRGLPSLIVAREPLTLRLLAEHCYSLDNGAGSLWALFAPARTAGAGRTALWLAEKAGDLAAVHRERRVVLASSLAAGPDRLGPLLEASAAALVLAGAGSREEAETVGARCRAAGLTGPSRRRRLLAVAGPSPLDDDEIRAATGLEVAARLQVLDDEQVLRGRPGRRERRFFTALDEIVARVEAPPAAGAPSAARPEAPTVDGAHALIRGAAAS